jgi:CRP-like cAMP-binding protein
MKNIFHVIKSNPLFQGIAFSDFEKMLGCLSARQEAYMKGDVILLSGDAFHFVGLVLSGSVRIIKEDREGRASILAEFGVPELFGETFACAGLDHSPVTVEAAEDMEVLQLDYRRIIKTCPASCPFHARLVENMLGIIASKNLALNAKIEILSKRTTREKLLCFFDHTRGPARKFTIPFNREELARYLCVDRSAMSGELGRMRDEGIIAFEKNVFEVLE